MIEKSFFIGVLILIVLAMVTGCMTTPDGRTVIDPVLLSQSLEALDMVMDRIEALKDEDVMTPAEIEQEQLRLELQRSLLLAAIEALRSGIDLPPDIELNLKTVVENSGAAPVR